MSVAHLMPRLESPLVSIVVNNYNNGLYLDDCLNALLNQTYDNIQIVVIDAFSTDNSRDILQNYSVLDTRIKLVYTEQYIKYPAITYNLGFLNCVGDYIAINDPDDISLPSRIESQINYLISHPDIGVVGCNCIEFNTRLEREVITTLDRNIWNAAPPARNPTLMFRKNILAQHGMWDWRCEYAADFEWLYRWYTNGVKFEIIDSVLLRYRSSFRTNISSKYAINQALKLSIFRTYYGIRHWSLLSPGWILKTLSTYVYVCSLSFKKILKSLRA